MSHSPGRSMEVTAWPVVSMAVHRMSLAGEVDEGNDVAGGGDDFVKEVI